MRSASSATFPRRRVLAMLGAGLALPLLAACGGAASATVSTGSASEAPATSSAASTAPLATSNAERAFISPDEATPSHEPLLAPGSLHYCRS